MQLQEKEKSQRHYLGKVESHLFAIKVSLMQSQSRLSCSQSITEIDPDPPERPEVLELHFWVKRTEQGLKTGLESEK